MLFVAEEDPCKVSIAVKFLIIMSRLMGQILNRESKFYRSGTGEVKNSLAEDQRKFVSECAENAMCI